MNSREWLDSLKAGDKVIIRSDGGLSDPCSVTRTTKTIIFVNAKNWSGEFVERRYKRLNGRDFSASSWHYESIIEPTHEIMSALYHQKLRRIASRYLKSVIMPNDADGLAAFINALAPYQTPNKEEK